MDRSPHPASLALGPESHICHDHASILCTKCFFVLILKRREGRRDTAMDSSLDDYEPSIQSKIEALHSGLATSHAEVESISREARHLLSQYGREVERCARFVHLYPELPISQHRRTRECLVEALHAAILEARAAIGRRAIGSSGPPSKGPASSPLVLADASNSVRPTTAIDPTAALAQEITDTLRSMSATLQEEVLRSETSYDIMQRSSKRMQATSEMYRSFGGLLGVTKRLIAGLWRRERTDRWMILAALTLFYSVLFYVALRRLWVGKLLMPTLRFLLSTVGSMIRSIPSLLSLLFLSIRGGGKSVTNLTSSFSNGGGIGVKLTEGISSYVLPSTSLYNSGHVHEDDHTFNTRTAVIMTMTSEHLTETEARPADESIDRQKPQHEEL